jgi:hypothetical protein
MFQRGMNVLPLDDANEGESTPTHQQSPAHHGACVCVTHMFIFSATPTKKDIMEYNSATMKSVKSNANGSTNFDKTL